MKYFVNGQEVSINKVKRLVKGEAYSCMHCLKKPFILKARMQGNNVYITKIITK